jgi:hypothetical protein
MLSLVLGVAALFLMVSFVVTLRVARDLSAQNDRLKRRLSRPRDFSVPLWVNGSNGSCTLYGVVPGGRACGGRRDDAR